MVLRIQNRDARRLWLDAQGLAAAPVGPVDLDGMIARLGFVQLDTIQVVARAHHHILWSRNQNYREPMLNLLLARDRGVFEHFTHDASVLPMATYPMWRRKFRHMEERVRGWEWHRGMLGEDGRAAIVARIRDEGPLSTHAFDTKVEGKRDDEGYFLLTGDEADRGKFITPSLRSAWSTPPYFHHGKAVDARAVIRHLTSGASRADPLHDPVLDGIAPLADEEVEDLRAFLRAVKTGQPIKLGPAIGWKTLLVANAAEASARHSGRRFELCTPGGEPIRTPDEAAEFAERECVV